MVTLARDGADTAGRCNTRLGGRPLVPRRAGVVSRSRMVEDTIDMDIGGVRQRTPRPGRPPMTLRAGYADSSCRGTTDLRLLFGVAAPQSEVTVSGCALRMALPGLAMTAGGYGPPPVPNGGSFGRFSALVVKSVLDGIFRWWPQRSHTSTGLSRSL